MHGNALHCTVENVFDREQLIGWSLNIFFALIHVSRLNILTPLCDLCALCG